MPAPTLESHPITEKGLRALCTAVLKTKNGDAWDVTNFNLRVKQLEAFAAYTGLYDPEHGSIVNCTYGSLFAGTNDEHKSPVDWIKAWVESPGDQGRGSIPTIAETVRRILALLDPDSEYLQPLAQLKTVAEQQSKERSVERASKAPPYSDFLRNKTTKLWTTGMCADASLGDVSVMAFCLTEVALTGSRGKLLRNMRYYSAETFDSEKLHRKPVRGAGEAPVSLVCDAEGPSKIVLGWSPNSDGTAQKNGKYAVVELSVPILPEAAHLLPLIKGSLTQLCQGLNDGEFVLRPKGKLQYGRDTLATNFRKYFDCPIGDDTGSETGGLRKSIENRARELYEKGEITEEQHLMVHHRLQHKAETALAKYTAPPDSDSDSDSDSDADSGSDSGSDSETEDLPDVDIDDAPVSTQDTDAENGGTDGTGDVTVAQFAHMLDSRQPELTYTDTGAGWKLINEVKPLPIDQVMAVLRDAYGCDAELTCDMIAAMDWLNAGADDFRASATDDDNIVAQLCAVLSGAEMPVLTRQYPHLDMTCSPPAQRGAEYFVAPRAHSDSDTDTGSDSEDDDPGPAVCALIAAFTAAYEQDRKRRRRR